MAAHGGRIAALNALSGNRHVYDDAAVPWVVFTDPEIAGVGLAARAAEEAGHEIAARVLPLSEVPRALVARDGASSAFSSPHPAAPTSSRRRRWRCARG